MKTKPKNDWINALEEAVSDSVDRPGPEWKTMWQLSEEFGLCHSATHRAIQKLLLSNRAEAKNFVTLNLAGRKSSIPHYRLIK